MRAEWEKFWGKPINREFRINGFTTLELLALAADHGMNANRTFIEYGECGSHDVYLVEYEED